MAIGAIGTKKLDDVVIFEVSDNKIMTFDSFERKNSVRFAKNDVLLKKPISEFVGPDLDKINFKIHLDAQFGTNPRDEMDKLIYIHRDGITVSLIIGKKAFGVFRWRIVDLNMSWSRVDNKGNLLSADLDIQLEEYV